VQKRKPAHLWKDRGQSERTFDQCVEGRQRIGHFAAQVALGFLSHLNRGNAVQNSEFA
jgi:hypothetical protein